MAYFVTPTLVVGAGPLQIETVPTSDVRDAVVLIGEGKTAQVPEDWDLVRDIMRQLGCDDTWIDNQVHWARTGEILPPV